MCAGLLTTLACRGPMTVRELARVIQNDPSPTFVAVEKFIAAKIILKSSRPGSRKRVSLNRAFPAYAELCDLLHRVGEHAGLAVAPCKRAGSASSRSATRTRRSPDIVALFGSKHRARLLLLFEARGELDRCDAAGLLGLPPASLEGPIRYLIKAGILRKMPRRGLVRPIGFDPSFFALNELRSLLRRLVYLTPKISALARLSSREVNGRRGPKWQPPKRKRSATDLDRAAHLVPFCDIGQARVLLLLSLSNRPLRVSDLARVAGVGTNSIGGAVRSLKRLNVLRTAVVGAIGHREMWVLLSPHRAMTPLKNLLKALVKTSGITAPRALKRPPPSEIFEPPDMSPLLEQLPRRSRLTTMRLVCNGTETDLSTVAQALHSHRRNAAKLFVSLERCGIIKTESRLGTRTATLAKNYPALRELKAFFNHL